MHFADCTVQHAIVAGCRGPLPFYAYSAFPFVWGHEFNALTFTASTS